MKTDSDSRAMLLTLLAKECNQSKARTVRISCRIVCLDLLWHCCASGFLTWIVNVGFTVFLITAQFIKSLGGFCGYYFY